MFSTSDNVIRILCDGDSTPLTRAFRYQYTIGAILTRYLNSKQGIFDYDYDRTPSHRVSLLTHEVSHG